MRGLRIALALLLLACAVHGGQIDVRVRGRRVAAPRAATDEMRVLFVGNSLTYFNEMPWIAERIAESLAVKPTLRTAFSGRSGATLKQQWTNAQVLRDIREGAFAYVVLQAQSTEIVTMPDTTLKYARLLDAEIRRSGAKTIVFVTWAPRTSGKTQNEYNRAYARLARELGAAVAPVGVAWDSLPSKGIDLFDGSGVHPNLAGSYLAACVFVSLLYDRSTVGAMHEFDVRFDIPEFYRHALEHERIDSETARAIQSEAWRAVTRAKMERAKNP